MVNIVEVMLQEGIVDKADIGKLVRMRPPKKINLSNLVQEKILDLNTVQTFLAKKVRAGTILLAEAEQTEGIDIEPVLKSVAEALKINYIDIDDTEIDMYLFSKVPYKQLTKHGALPIEESELSVTVVFEDPLDMIAQDAIQRLFPRKPITVALASPRKVNIHLQRLGITQSVKGLVDEIRKEFGFRGIW